MPILDLCEVCGNRILPERREALPETRTCCSCSTVRKRQGVMNYSHKTAGEIVFLSDDPEQRRIQERAYRRAR
jgi:RNA polymerase-binding transcription factor DksA